AGESRACPAHGAGRAGALREHVHGPAHGPGLPTHLPGRDGARPRIGAVPRNSSLMAETPITIVPVILSGGAGTRLWPVSREGHPKPFMKLPDGQTLPDKTVQRALGAGTAT